MQKLYCVLSLFLIIFQSTARAVPLRYRRAFSYIANETACTVDHIVYKDGDPIPTDDPCESCKCRPPGFSCVLRECEVKTGCKAIRRAGECCPQYQCGCEHNGNYYGDGDRIPNAESPCYSCYCQGSSITCSLADCKFRFDCEPEYILGECCPRYDHCPPENIPTSVTVKSTTIPLLTTLFTKSTTSQSVTTTPMPITTTPLTTSPSPYTTTPITEPKTTPLTTSTTPSLIITTPSITTTSTTPLTTSSTPAPTTTEAVPTTTPPAATLITTEPPTTSPALITTPSTSTSISSITTVYSTLPAVVKEQTTTISTSESETLVPSDSVTESSTKSQVLPELTFPTTIRLAESSSTEYSTIGITKESSETKATTEYSTNTQTIAPNIETSAPSFVTSSKSTQTSGPLSEIMTTIKSETTTQSAENVDKEVVTNSISPEIITEVNIETIKELVTTPQMIPQMTTTPPERVTNTYESTTQANPERQTNAFTIPLVTETVTISGEITTKQNKDESSPSEAKTTTESVNTSKVMTTKPFEEELKIETTTQLNKIEENPPKTDIIESAESTKQSVSSESSPETTTLSSDLEISKTDAITTTTPEVVKLDEPKTQPNYVMSTEKSTERLQTTVAFTQNIVSETTTPSVNVYETTLKAEEIKNEENPIESDISSDSMIEVPGLDPTIVKSDQVSISNSEATTPNIISNNEEKIEEILTKETTITIPYETVGSDDSSLTTKKISDTQSLVTETTKSEELTTKLSEEKIETLSPEEPKSVVNSEETTTQGMTTMKVFIDINGEITTISVTDTNVDLNQSQNTTTNTTTQSNVDNNETTSPSATTDKLLPNQNSETTLRANEELSSETTTVNVISDQMTTQSDKNGNSMETETMISDKGLDYTESVTTTAADSESWVSTIDSSIIY